MDGPLLLRSVKKNEDFGPPSWCADQCKQNHYKVMEKIRLLSKNGVLYSLWLYQ